MRLLISGTMVIMAIVIYLIIAPVMIEEINVQQEKEYKTKLIAHKLQRSMERHAISYQNIYTDNKKDILTDIDASSIIQFGKGAHAPGEVGIVFVYQENIIVDYIINGIGIDGQEIIILTKNKFL